MDKTKHTHSPSARAYDSAGLGWDSQIYISHKCPGDAEVADGGHILRTTKEHDLTTVCCMKFRRQSNSYTRKNYQQ